MQHLKEYTIIALLLFVLTFVLASNWPSVKKGSSPHTPDIKSHTQKTAMESKYTLELPVRNLGKNGFQTIQFSIQDQNNTVVRNFEPVHEKLMHVIVVSEDLQDFQHVHPAFDTATGIFRADITFAKNGKYFMYADFKPASFEETDEHSQQEVVAAELQVGGKQTQKLSKILTDQSKIHQTGEYTVEYNMKNEAKLRIETFVRKNGNEVTDLEPYLGAFGHCVLINAQTHEYLHVHSVEEGNKAGPKVTFESNKLSKGIYKAFFQFQHTGAVKTSEYTFEVK